jgi:taurine dioxygenase
MFTVEPSGEILGATVRGIDLSRPLDDRDFGRILRVLGQYSVLRFPDQYVTPEQQRTFTQRFGGSHQNVSHRWPGVPEISILSNIVENGESIGYLDAGMIWHRDVTNRKVPAFATVLHALKVPMRDGKSLGNTQFVNSQAAYDDLPAALKQRLASAVAIHDSRRYNQRVREAGSMRPPSEKLSYSYEPVAHPLVRPHPITGRDTLYCDPGNVDRLEGLGGGDADAAEILTQLFDHQLKDKYHYSFSWAERDVLMWENFGTLHRAVLDYGPDEHRLIQRSQAMADKVLAPGFVRDALARAEA